MICRQTYKVRHTITLSDLANHEPYLKITLLQGSDRTDATPTATTTRLRSRNTGRNPKGKKETTPLRRMKLAQSKKPPTDRRHRSRRET